MQRQFGGVAAILINVCLTRLFLLAIAVSSDCMTAGLQWARR